MSNFANDRHTLYVGWVLGIAVRNGLDAVPVLDDAGNYTDRLEIRFKNDMTQARVFIIVPEPPEDWEL